MTHGTDLHTLFINDVNPLRVPKHGMGMIYVLYSLSKPYILHLITYEYHHKSDVYPPMSMSMKSYLNQGLGKEVHSGVPL